MLSLALGATQANAQVQAQDSSVDVTLGSSSYRFVLADFPGFTKGALSLETLPDRGTITRGDGRDLSARLGWSNPQAQFFFHGDFTDPRGPRNWFQYTPPADAISVTTGYTSFIFNFRENAVNSMATMTINLVGASSQMNATGAPTVAATTGTAYNTSVPLTATITGVTDPNGINVSTLSWQWQQADAPATGVPATSAYSDIEGAVTTGVTSSDFTPLVAHAGKYIRVCASFMDQFSTPASEQKCSTGSLVNDAPTFGDASVADVVWLTGNAVNLVLPQASGGNGALTYSLTPALPTGLSFTAATRTISGTPTAATAEATHTLTATDTDGDTDTLAFAMAVEVDAAPAFATNASIADQIWVVGRAIADLTPPAASGGNGALTYSLTPALPAGLTFDPATRTISGTPTAAAAPATYTLAVTDADSNTAGGDSASLTFSTEVVVAPGASDATHTTERTDEDSNTITIPASIFINAFSDPDNDPLSSITITTLPPTAHGTLTLNNTPVQAGDTLPITNNDFTGAPLTLTITTPDLQSTTLSFTLSDGKSSSDVVILTITITTGQDIAEEQAVQISAILSATALTNATTAISGAIAAPATDLSIDGTSLIGTAQKLGQSKTADSPHQAWYLGTAPQWEHNAAYNASDNSRASLLNRLQSMANGDIALNYSLTDTSTMRFWARYQSLDLSGNEGESLEYDGSGTGFYLGADNQITETMRIGLAIGTDSSDITLDLDEDGTDDEATRSATSFYPYLHIDLGNNNNARVIAGFGSGTLDIKSTANSNSTASADLSWNMLAASISHHRPMKGNLSARFDGSLQLGNTSVDETTFSGGSTLMAADSSTNELSINAELRYQKNNITPFASLAARKLGGDLSQAMAMDLGLGADLQTSPANLRLAITRQINDTTHQRHSISLDASTKPSASGISASLGSRYDSITGRPQWNTRLRWQRRAAELSLAASPGDYRLRARLRW